MYAAGSKSCIAGSSVSSVNSMEINSFCKVGPTKTGTLTRFDTASATSDNLAFSAFRVKFKMGLVLAVKVKAVFGAILRSCVFAASSWVSDRFEPCASGFPGCCEVSPALNTTTKNAATPKFFPSWQRNITASFRSIPGILRIARQQIGPSNNVSVESECRKTSTWKNFSQIKSDKSAMQCAGITTTFNETLAIRTGLEKQTEWPHQVVCKFPVPGQRTSSEIRVSRSQHIGEIPSSSTPAASYPEVIPEDFS